MILNSRSRRMRSETPKMNNSIVQQLAYARYHGQIEDLLRPEPLLARMAMAGIRLVNWLRRPHVVR